MLHFETGIDSVSLATCDISYSILKLNTKLFTESRSSAWLEHYTDNVGVSSSNLLGTTILGGLAQLARAPALHAGGQRFESVILHYLMSKLANELMSKLKKHTDHAI